MYQALAMNDQRQIAVQHEAAVQEIDPFIELLRSIQSELHGELRPRSEKGFCYELEAAALRLVFCWSRETGILVTVPQETGADAADSLIFRHCARLNALQQAAPLARVSVRRAPGAGKKIKNNQPG